MTNADLRAKCLNAINHPIVGGRNAAVALVLPGMSRGEKRRLAGRSGPLGRIASDGDDDTQVVCFKAEDVLKFLDQVESAGT